MKFTSLQLKQIIKEEINKVLSEAEEKTPEEKALSLEQQNALKNAANKLNGEEMQLVNHHAISERAPQTETYKIQAEYIKRDQTTGKPRHIKGAIVDFSGGLPFEINYDASTKQFIIEFSGLSANGDNLIKTFKGAANQALTALKEEGGEFDKNIYGVASQKRYSSSDWEGGERDPGFSGKVKDIYGPGASGGNVVLTTVKKVNKWGGRW